MTFKMLATVKGLEKKADQMERSRIDAALEDSLQIIMQSTKMGFEKRVSPQGVPWKSNPIWWQEIKGQNSPLTGPVTSTIQGGELKDVYKLKKANAARMANSLIKSKSGMTGEVRYNSAAKERAKINQHGGKSELEFIPLSKVSPYQHNLVFNVDIISRPHLGIATYPRIGDKTDAEWCEFYFGREVDVQLKNGFL